MVISGILVACNPQKMETVIESINAIDWADVHQREDIGKMVVTIEAESTDQAVDRLTELQKLPDIFAADMVEHYFEDETDSHVASDGEKGLERLNKSKTFKRFKDR